MLELRVFGGRATHASKKIGFPRNFRHNTDDGAACTVSYHIWTLALCYWFANDMHFQRCNTTWGLYID
jgi:hypothetical protein